MSKRAEAYPAWQDYRQAFWGDAAKPIDWFTPANAVFNANEGAYVRWFDGATCYNCDGRHVEAGHEDRRRHLS